IRQWRTSANVSADLRSTTYGNSVCGQIVDNRGARLCRDPRKYALLCVRPTSADQSAYVAVARRDKVSSMARSQRRGGSSSLLPSSTILRSRSQAKDVHRSGAAKYRREGGPRQQRELRMASQPSLTIHA